MRRSIRNRLQDISNQVYTYSFSLSGKAPKVKFVIFAQGRTGSRLLCHLLESHPKIYADREILFNHKPFPISYVKAKSRLIEPKTVYGFKVKIYQLTNKQNLDPKYFLNELTADGWKIIYLKRNNHLRHAISNQVARSRQQFHAYDAMSDKKNG